MAKNYGLPYQGSKNRIAGWVVENLPDSPVFVDLFAGGCAITHKALESGRYGSFIANDLTGFPSLFLDAIEGKYKDETRWISREDFERLKDTDLYVACCWSFGNCLTNYMYAKELEDWKKALHYARVFNDFSLFEDMGIHTDASNKDIKQNKEEYKKKYIDWWLWKYYKTTLEDQRFKEENQKTEEELRNYLRNALKKAGLSQSDFNRKLGFQMAGHYFGKSQWTFPTREVYTKMKEFMALPIPYDECVEPWKGNLQSLQSLQRLESLEVYQKDYRDINVEKASFYYCDPPYKNTKGYGAIDFDFEAFENWLETIDKPCIVSSYEAPRGCVEIAAQQTRGLFAAGKVNKVIEKLFIQEKYLHWYEDEMKKSRGQLL